MGRWDKSIEINRVHDIPHMEHKWDARGRPYPWDATVSLTVAANATPNVFGNYLLVFAAGTYDFGDTPNEIQIREIVIEDISANDVYILELSKYLNPDYTPMGAVRFSRTNVINRSFPLVFLGREFSADTEVLYARLKCGLGSGTVKFSVTVARYLSVEEHVPYTTGVFPFA